MQERRNVLRVGGRDSIGSYLRWYLRPDISLYTCVYARMYKLYLYYPANFTQHGTSCHAHAIGLGYQVSGLRDETRVYKMREENEVAAKRETSSRREKYEL